jgi:4-amino-4-deoxy-L-arabinose transferase-like glycosyltransferase
MNLPSLLFSGPKLNREKAAPVSGFRTVYIFLSILAFFTLAAVYHIILQPYPNNWDDAWYAIHTFRWIDFIQQSPDILRGIFWGFVYVLPPHMPPLVFITNLLSGVAGKSLIAMRYAQLIWFVILLASVYGIGSRVRGRRAGIFALILVSSTTLVFYWSKTIMGEPALFAIFAFFLFLLVSWGDRLTYLRSAILGAVFGLGLLTKQHFIILTIGPLGLWVLWYLFLNKKSVVPWKQKFIHLVFFLLPALLVASPWYILNFRAFLAHITGSEGFAPHSLAQYGFWGSILVYMRNFVDQVGVPGVVLFLAGNLFALYQLWVSIKGKKLFEWDSQVLLILFIPGAFLLAIVLLQRNINTRFITPALISWGILAGFAVARFLRVSNKAWLGWAILVIFHLLFWWNQSFSPIATSAFPLFPQKSFMRPIDITPLPQAIDQLAAAIPAGSNPRIYVVGETSRFNPDLVFALIKERDIQSEPQRLYSFEDPNDLELILSRLPSAEYIILYESIADRRDLFTNFYFDSLLTRFDRDILAWVKSHPEEFHQISKLESIEDNNRIWIYQIISEKSISEQNTVGMK